MSSQSEYEINKIRISSILTYLSKVNEYSGGELEGEAIINRINYVLEEVNEYIRFLELVFADGRGDELFVYINDYNQLYLDTINLLNKLSGESVDRENNEAAYALICECKYELDMYCKVMDEIYKVDFQHILGKYESAVCADGVEIFAEKVLSKQILNGKEKVKVQLKIQYIKKLIFIIGNKKYYRFENKKQLLEDLKKILENNYKTDEFKQREGTNVDILLSDSMSTELSWVIQLGLKNQESKTMIGIINIVKLEGLIKCTLPWVSLGILINIIKEELNE